MRSVAVLGTLVSICLSAQPSRDAYRNAYKTWRQTEAALEQDAGPGGAAVAQRAALAATESAKFGVERSAFLLDLADEQVQNLSWLENAAPSGPPPDLTKGLVEFVNAQKAAVGRNVDTFASDADKGIQQLRVALQREQAVLTALSGTMVERQKSAKAVDDAAATAESARLKAVSQYRDLVAGLKQASEQVDRETQQWQDYYRKLAEGAVATATPTDSSRTPLPVPPLMASITSVPLSRYEGDWAFPAVNGLYHGLQPEAVDLTIHEENGHADGTLVARFKLPPGSTEDPIVRFGFSGDFKNERNQVFSIKAANGAKGTIELIPGPAFNLLEVNFQIESRPGKVRRGNVLLVKK